MLKVVLVSQCPSAVCSLQVIFCALLKTAIWQSYIVDLFIHLLFYIFSWWYCVFPLLCNKCYCPLTLFLFLLFFYMLPCRIKKSLIILCMSLLSSSNTWSSFTNSPFGACIITYCINSELFSPKVNYTKLYRTVESTVCKNAFCIALLECYWNWHHVCSITSLLNASL